MEKLDAKLRDLLAGPFDDARPSTRTIQMKLWTLMLLVLLGSSCARSGSHGPDIAPYLPNKCGDLLQYFKVKPPQLRFVSCKRGDGQVLFEARYKVRAAQAAEVERLLNQKYGMAKLRFACCGWEPTGGKAGSFKPSKTVRGRSLHYEISMHSAETLLTRRQQWPKIRFFTVTAKILDI